MGRRRSRSKATGTRSEGGRSGEGKERRARAPRRSNSNQTIMLVSLGAVIVGGVILVAAISQPQPDPLPSADTPVTPQQAVIRTQPAVTATPAPAPTPRAKPAPAPVPAPTLGPGLLNDGPPKNKPRRPARNTASSESEENAPNMHAVPDRGNTRGLGLLQPSDGSAKRTPRSTVAPDPVEEPEDEPAEEEPKEDFENALEGAL